MTLERIEELKAQLSQLAIVLNEFKSEAVQLRILELVLQGQQSPAAAHKKEEEPGRHRRGERKHTGSRIDEEAESAVTTRRKRGAVGSGAPATLEQLLVTTFFEQPRTINDIIEHCKHKLARTFKANEFSGKLGRMVRNGQLTRQKNSESQYEYKKP